MIFDKRNHYLLARDIMDWHEYNEDGTVKYYSKYLAKDGSITWVDQYTDQIIYME